MAFEEQNSATDFYDSYHDQLNDKSFNNPITVITIIITSQ